MNNTKNDAPTENISRLVKERGIKLTTMSKRTGIPYESLRSSLLKNNVVRSLKADEYFRICDFLDIDPLEYRQKRPA